MGVGRGGSFPSSLRILLFRFSPSLFSIRAVLHYLNAWKRLQGNHQTSIHLQRSNQTTLPTDRAGTALETMGAFHLVKISGISGSAVNGTRFVGSSHWKIPGKSGKSKKVVPFSRLEFPNGMSCSIYASRSLYQFQVH